MVQNMYHAAELLYQFSCIHRMASSSLNCLSNSYSCKASTDMVSRPLNAYWRTLASLATEWVEFHGFPSYVSQAQLQPCPCIALATPSTFVELFSNVSLFNSQPVPAYALLSSEEEERKVLMPQNWCILRSCRHLRLRWPLAYIH